jgi:hypothetical protein
VNRARTGLLLLATVGALVALATPASAATRTYTKKAVCSLPVSGWPDDKITNVTEFRVSSAGRVHVNKVTISVSGFSPLPVRLRVDYDLRVKDSNARLAYGSFTGTNTTWTPSNGETIHGLKTTARGWHGSDSCNATVASD